MGLLPSFRMIDSSFNVDPCADSCLLSSDSASAGLNGFKDLNDQNCKFVSLGAVKSMEPEQE